RRRRSLGAPRANDAALFSKLAVSERPHRRTARTRVRRGCTPSVESSALHVAQGRRRRVVGVSRGPRRRPGAPLCERSARPLVRRVRLRIVAWRSAVCALGAFAAARGAMSRAQTGAARENARTISVIVATLNRAALLDECLTHMARQRFEPSDEVIVVDNGSTDETALVIERHRRAFPAALLGLTESRPGKSHA